MPWQYTGILVDGSRVILVMCKNCSDISWQQLNLNQSKANCPNNLNSDGLIVREMGPWPECIFRSLLQFLVSLIKGNFEWNLSANSRTGNKYQDACAMSIGPRIIEIRLLQALIWTVKVKFMCVVIGQGNAVSPVSNWFTYFLLYINLTNNSWYTTSFANIFDTW